MKILIMTQDNLPLEIAEVVRETKTQWVLSGSRTSPMPIHVRKNGMRVQEPGHPLHRNPCRRIDKEDVAMLEKEALRTLASIQKWKTDRETEAQRQEELKQQKRQEAITAFWYKEGREIWSRRREVTIAGIPLILLERPAHERVEQNGKTLVFAQDAKAALLHITPDLLDPSKVLIERGGIVACSVSQNRFRPSFWSGSTYTLPAKGYEQELVYNELR
jgi:hypothetical protein